MWNGATMVWKHSRPIQRPGNHSFIAMLTLPFSLSLSLSHSSYSSYLTCFTISRKRHLSYEVLSDKRPKRHLNTAGEKEEGETE